MNTTPHRPVALCLIAFALAAQAATAAPLPDVDDLPTSEALPDPLVMLDGTKVTSKKQWLEKRRPQLKALFQHYMYGYLPPAPKQPKWQVRKIDKSFFGGKATFKEVRIWLAPHVKDGPFMDLMVIVPNKRTGPAPVWVGLNFGGNHTLVDSKQVTITQSWMRGRGKGVVNNRATEEGRGTRKERWSIENTIDRGYAVATFYYGDVDPDKPDFTDGVHPFYRKPGQTDQGPHDWGAIAAWAWGIHRAVDYIYADKDLDNHHVACYGHSRNGKAALLSAAFDQRIDLVVPHQAGCGGTGPSRSHNPKAESVKRINTVFPHWFNDTFPKFNDQVDRLPFDQHCLVALCAPRPVLFTNGTKDQWSNPGGQFEMLKAANPVYHLLGSDGLVADKMPPLDKLVDSTLGYYIREGVHTSDLAYWNVFIDFADKHFGRK